MSFRVVCATKPTPFMTTYWARHMVATWNLLYDRGTFFTALNCCWVLPLFYFVFKNTATTFKTMSLMFAFGTYFKLTFRTWESFLFLLNWNYNSTFRIWTPHKVRIFLNLKIFHKFFVDSIGFTRNELLDNLVSKFDIAMRTEHRLNIHTSNLLINICSHALITYRVLLL